MSPTYRVAKALLLFAVAGLIVSCSMAATAVVGVIAGSTGSTMPSAFVVLFWLLCAAFGVPFAWLVTVVSGGGEER